MGYVNTSSVSIHSADPYDMRRLVQNLPQYIHFGTTHEELVDVVNEMLKWMAVSTNVTARHEDYTDAMVTTDNVTEIIREEIGQAIDVDRAAELLENMEQCLEINAGPTGPRGPMGPIGLPGPQGLAGMNYTERAALEEQLEQLKDLQAAVEDILEALDD